MNNTSEVEQVKARYARRADLGEADRYSMLDPAVWQSVQERQRALISLLRSNAQNPLTDLRVLEIGCGSGGNLLELLRMRFDPNKLVGNELLEDRASLARRNLPSAVDLHVGDATALTFEPGSFDVVYQSTVFSSLLDDSFQELLAQKMWEWVSSGGGGLWYDFTFKNPNNPDVRGVTLRRIADLFPDGEIDVRRVTLAPPISRRVCKVHPALYPIFNAIPLLRTHVLCWIGKK